MNDHHFNGDIERLQRKIDNLYDAIEQEVTPETMALVYEVVRLELHLEAECNQ